MTINIAISVSEGLVMAADSLSQVGAGDDVHSLHQSVEKITEIRGRPIAVMINGLGEIEKRTILSLIREFEFRKYHEPGTPIRNWSVAEVTSHLKAFLEPRYQEAYSAADKRPELGVIVGGYSHESFFPELYELDFAKASFRTVIPTRPGILTGEERIEYWGKRCALDRILLGFDPQALNQALNIARVKAYLADRGEDMQRLNNDQLGDLMKDLLAEPSPDDDAFIDRLVSVSNLMSMPTRLRGMPLQEAVEFADYLGQTAIGYDRFCSGSPAVGGELDVVAIQPDGLHWYRRKGFLNEMARARERSVMNDDRDWMREMLNQTFAQMTGGPGGPPDLKKLAEIMEGLGLRPQPTEKPTEGRNGG